LEEGTTTAPSLETPEGNLPEPEKEKPLPAISTQPPVVTFRPPSSQKRAAREPAPTPAYHDDLPIGRGVPAEVRELRELRRELAQARTENKELDDRLLRKSAELQSALVDVDKTKVNVVELKSQLAQTTTSLENIKKDGAAVPGIRAEFEKSTDILGQFADVRQ
jgi:hypothetical protein